MKTKFFGILMATVCALSLTPAMAQTSKEAVELYKAGKYGPALAAFEAVDKKEPRNPMTHYYIALCCQGLNQVARAKQEYEWVAANCKNAALRAAAQKGLDGVSRYGDARSAQVAASAANAEAAKAAKQPAATATADAAKDAKTGKDAKDTKDKDGKTKVAAKPGAMKVSKIIQFQTDWERMCKVFEPTFDEVKSRYSGKITFQSLNGDDEANAALKQKYNVNSYPTLVYLDANGNVLKNESGAPNDADSFQAEIESLNTKK